MDSLVRVFRRRGCVLKAEFDFFDPLPAHPKHSQLTLFFTGGVCASQTSKGWVLEPLVIDKTPHMIGFLSSDELRDLLTPAGALPIFYEQQGVSGGVRFSFYQPWTSGPIKPGGSALDRWSSIAGNLPDNKTRERELANHIHLCLMSINVHLSRVASFYCDQLVGSIHSDKTLGNRFANGIDYKIAASVHDFYTSVGTARDHLAALIATRIGKSASTDDLTRLLRTFKQNETFEDPMIKMMQSNALIRWGQGKWEAAGVLGDINKLRKRLVHKTPFGSFEVEGWGEVKKATCRGDAELRVYERSIQLDDGRTEELLRTLRHHYLFTMELFSKAAIRSGYDHGIKMLTEREITSVRITRG